MSTAPLDLDVLRRHDRQGPRYTSYPSSPQFRGDFGEEQLRRAIWRSNVHARPRPLSLYLHIPYCESPCLYCGCNRLITRDHAQGQHYVARLLQEMRLVAPLFDRRRQVLQLHLGGGTPNFLSTAEIARIVDGLRRAFHLSDAGARDFSIELDPRHVRPGDISALAGLGFNRVSLGVQDFDRTVQSAVNRLQSIEETLAVIDACRKSAMRSVNVDLIYGLPHQSPAGFARTLDVVIGARPDRLAVYGYAHLPALFKAQSRLVAAELPGGERRLQLLELAVERLGAAGYRYIGMDHFALPEDELSQAHVRGCLHRNFMGYTTHAGCDLLGLGVSAISHLADTFSQNHRDLASWEAALDRDALPLCRGLQLDDDDLLRADVIQQLMCTGRVDIAQIEEHHGIDFATYFAQALEQLRPLVADELAILDAHHLTATARGRFLVRAIAMCFDRYLAQATGPARFSKLL
jgi:oxygen-independent coproporphyrinogen III oxidase